MGKFSFISGSVRTLYDEFMDTPGSIRNKTINTAAWKERVYDPFAREEVTFKEFVTRHSTKKDGVQYLRDWFDLGRGRLARWMRIEAAAKDTIEDIIEGAELGSTFAGPGGIPVQIGSNTVEIPIYQVTQTLHDALDYSLGTRSGVYRRNMYGRFDYLVDRVKGRLGATVAAVPYIGSVLEMLTNMDEKDDRIIRAAVRDAHYRILKKRGVSDVDALKLRDLPIRRVRKDPDLQKYAHVSGYAFDHEPAAHTQYEKRAA